MNKQQLILMNTIVFHVYSEDGNIHLRFLDTSGPIRTNLSWIEKTIEALFEGHEVEFIKIDGKLYTAGSHDEMTFAPDDFGFYPVVQSKVRLIDKDDLVSLTNLYCDEDLDMSTLHIS